MSNDDDDDMTGKTATIEGETVICLDTNCATYEIDHEKKEFRTTFKDKCDLDVDVSKKDLRNFQREMLRSGYRSRYTLKGAVHDPDEED